MAAEDRPRTRRGVVAAVALLGLLFAALLAYGLVKRAPDRTIDDALAKGQTVRAPDFRLKVLRRGSLGPVIDARLRGALADGWVESTELLGQPHMINIWASWCAPCREEAPVLARGWPEARRQGVLFVGLDMQDATDDALNFLEKLGLDYLNIRDPTNEVMRRYGATGIPETYFVSARGEVVGHVIGAISQSSLRAGVRAARLGVPDRARRGGAQRPSR